MKMVYRKCGYVIDEAHKYCPNGGYYLPRITTILLALDRIDKNAPAIKKGWLYVEDHPYSSIATPSILFALSSGVRHLLVYHRPPMQPLVFFSHTFMKGPIIGHAQVTNF